MKSVAAGFTEAGLQDDLKQVCQFWATRTTGQASDGVFLAACPANGCIGFAFTLPQGFAAKSYTDSAADGLAKSYPNSSP